MPYSFLPIPKGFQRLDPFPLDSTFVFQTLQELKDYALSVNNTAYIGQICTVISDESLYLIKQDRTLKKLNEDTSIFSFISSNSSGWVYQGSDIHALTGYWDSAYTTVKNNSALNWNYQGSDLKNLSAGWIGGNYAYTNLVSNSAGYLSSVDLSFLSVSSNWDSTYTTVGSNSSTTWNYQGADIKNLSSGWVGGNDAYTNLVSNSAGYLSAVDLSFLSVSGNWDSAYTTVGANSSTWNYQGTDLKVLSSGWVGGNDAYTNLVSNSAGYLSAVDLSFLSVSGNWDSTYTTVGSNSSTTWNYQGTDLKVLSSGWVGGNDAYTNLVSNSASYLSSADLSFLSVSGNWNSVYTDVSNASGDWDSVYSTVKTNSASFLSTSSDIQEFFDDFITLGASSTLPNALLKQINSGGSIFIVPEDGKQGVLTVGTNNLMISNQRGSATSNETIHFGQGDDYRLIFSARRGSNSFTGSLSGRFDMGFHDMLGTNSSSPNDGCYFSSENGENWKTNTKTGVLSLITNDTGVPCDDSWRTFEIHVNSDGTIVNFYIDNVLVSAHTQSIPSTSGSYTALGYRAYRYTNDPVNLELRLDWQKIIIKRQSNLW